MPSRIEITRRGRGVSDQASLALECTTFKRLFRMRRHRARPRNPGAAGSAVRWQGRV